MYHNRLGGGGGICVYLMNIHKACTPKEVPKDSCHKHTIAKKVVELA